MNKKETKRVFNLITIIFIIFGFFGYLSSKQPTEGRVF